MGSSRTGTADCEGPCIFVEALTDRPDSDGVDPFDNPLLVSISTNSTGPLNLVATVGSLTGGGGGRYSLLLRRTPRSPRLTTSERKARATPPTWPRVPMCK